ncbi:MAG TPA: Trm112 family protein [Cyclobacteriaceae bacterium]|nr:Trm112 family protein [Cyclobacteriaceae bacterium]
MKLSLINKLCCPQDKNDLSLQVFAKKQDETIQEGLLTCSHCGRYYPIVYGIPIMTPDEYRERALEQPLLKKWGLSMGGGKKFMLEIEEGA